MNTTALHILRKIFGYESFRGVQEAIMKDVLSGKDVFVLMPTGGGKSLCFQVPALVLPGMTLVISPLLSLMKDQVDTLCHKGVVAAYINSSQSREMQEYVLERVRRGEIKILYLAPERVVLASFGNVLREVSISLIAVDEAHCISEWGHDFRPEYTKLYILRQWLPKVPIIALTASATFSARQDIVVQLRLQNPCIYVSSFFRDNLWVRVLPKEHAVEKIRQLLDHYTKGARIIYVRTRREAEWLCVELQKWGYEGYAYHAGLDASVRASLQEQFIAGSISLIVATIAFGMGVDKSDVRLVIHYTLSASLEGFYQEIGRAGRDGQESMCVLLYDPLDVEVLSDMVSTGEDTKQQQNKGEKIQVMRGYAEAEHCRWKYILKYFGEVTDKMDGCGRCDRCVQLPVVEGYGAWTRTIVRRAWHVWERIGIWWHGK